MADKRVPLSALTASPINFFALGAGAGLAPKAPGTFGTVVAIPLLFLMPQNLMAYMAILLAMFVVGVWLCDRCATSLGVHDHPAIVWDEIVGYLLTMIAAPRSFMVVLLGFALFRLFDVLKPWPISLADKRVHGGFGIMIDDVIAGVFAAISLQLILLAVNIYFGV